MRGPNLVFLPLLGQLLACQPDLTLGEAREAVEESATASQASALTSASVELSTRFTLGQAAAQAAAELQAFVRSQLPCAEVSRESETLRIEYGARGGACSYNGHTFEGSHSVTITRIGERDVAVQHLWEGFSNGRVSVTGSAEVTWSATERTRRIVHETTWTRLIDGMMGVGDGERTQTAFGSREQRPWGIRVDGERSWEGDAGRWALDIDGIEMLWMDAAPQAGSYVLQTPFGKSLTLSFERLDSSRIAVSANTGRRVFEFTVSSQGAVENRKQ